MPAHGDNPSGRVWRLADASRQQAGVWATLEADLRPGGKTSANCSLGLHLHYNLTSGQDRAAQPSQVQIPDP